MSSSGGTQNKRCAAANVYYFIQNYTTFIVTFSTCTFSYASFLFRRAYLSDFVLFFLIMGCTYQIMSVRPSSHFGQLILAFQFIHGSIFIHCETLYFLIGHNSV